MCSPIPFTYFTYNLHIVAVTLECTIPRDYPNCVPELKIIIDKGLSKKQGDDLTVLVNATAEENVGMPSIFVIAEAVKDWLADNNTPGQDGSMYADMMRRMTQKETETKKQNAAKDEYLRNMNTSSTAGGDGNDCDLAVDKEELERLRKRKLGTLVTPESFAAWKVKFDKEMKSSGDPFFAGNLNPVLVETPSATMYSTKSVFNFAAPSVAAIDDSNLALTESEIAFINRPTGKELFLMNKANAEFAYLDDNDDVLGDAMDKFISNMDEDDGDMDDEEDDSDYDGSDDGSDA